MTGKRERLLPRFSEVDPVYPGELHEVKLLVVGGPNMQLLNDCMMAPSLDEVLRRACEFVVLIPLQFKGQNQPWPKEIEHYYRISIPLAVFGHRRVVEHKFDFLSRVARSHGMSTPTLLIPTIVVKISNYDFRLRVGRAVTSSFDYCKLLDFLVSGAFPLADRSH